MAPVRQSLLNFVMARKEFLTLSMECGAELDSPKFRALQEGSAQTIAKQIGMAPSLSVDDANALINVIKDAPLLTEGKANLRELIGDKVLQVAKDEVGEAAPAKVVKQKTDMAHCFLTADDWRAMKSPQTSLAQRTSVLGIRFMRLGLFYPDEFAVKNVLALAFLDQGEPEAFQATALHYSEIFKKTLKQGRGRQSRELPQFDVDVQEFKSKHPSWYKEGYTGEDEQPSPPQCDVGIMRFMISKMACRKTKAGAAAPPVHLNSLQQVLGMLQHHHAGLPNLQIFQQRPPATPERRSIRAPSESGDSLSPWSPPPIASSAAVPPQAAPQGGQMLALEGPAAAAPASSGAAALAVLDAHQAVACTPALLDAPREIPEKATPLDAPQALTPRATPALLDAPRAKLSQVVLDAPQASAAASQTIIEKYKGMIAGAKEDHEPAPKKPRVAIFKKPAALDQTLKRPAAAASLALPKGWKREQRVRMSGESKGICDKYYIAPDGKACRSLRQMRAYADKA